jgi:hypothetical protein
LTSLLRTTEANELLSSVDDPITHHLLSNVLYRLLLKYQVRREVPIADLDLRYFVEILVESFADHNALRRILAGELVGSLYDDEQLKSWTK